jgi:hypothetical protein
MKGSDAKNGKRVNGKFEWVGGQYINGSSIYTMPKYLGDGDDLIKNHFLPKGNTNYCWPDEEDEFKKNLLTQPDDWRYRTKEVVYTFNSHGYRVEKEFDEVDWKNAIVVFGCSMVFGQGVSNDETLPYFLGKLFNREVVNLGVPSCSNEFMLDNAIRMKNKYGIPYAMVMMWTLSNRLPYYGEESVKHLGMWGNFESNELGHADYNCIVNNLYYNKSNEFTRLYNTLQIGREIFADKTNYFDGSFFCETAHYGKCYDRFGFKNGARDLVHAGPEDLERIANEIKTIMDNEIIK